MNKWRRDCLPRRLKEGRLHQEDDVLVVTGEMRRGMNGVCGGRGNGGRGDGGGSGDCSGGCLSRRSSMFEDVVY